MNYTPYHVHSDLSILDSATKSKMYIEKAKELGIKAFGESNHGNIFNWVKRKQITEEAGLKYIHAQEFYITETLKEKIRDNYHTVLIAKNWEGVKELNKLSSVAYNRQDNHFYYDPRISIDELLNTSDNIIVTSSCLASPLWKGKDRNIYNKYLQFFIANKHRCFLEIQYHNCNEQKEYNKQLYELHKKYNIPLIAGTDTHSINQDFAEARKILMQAKNIAFTNEDTFDLTFKSYDELVEAFKKQNVLPMNIILEAIENTNIMADMIEEFTIDTTPKYPKLYSNSEEVFRQKIQEGIKKRGIDKLDEKTKQIYINRINYEYEVYKKCGAIDYMLMQKDIIDWCHKNNIWQGYSRGSVSGSLIAYVLGITEADSIKYNLNFERFMNPERVSLADIDVDYPPSQRDKVKKYVFNKPNIYCADIITFNTVALKGAIRDTARALKIPLNEVNYICENIDKQEEEFRKLYPKLFKYVDLLNGVNTSVGFHPCGSITSPITLEDNIGLFTTSTDEYPISQINMKEIDSLNYVKLDLLALDNIEIINETCKLAEIERLTPNNVDTNDEKVWNSILESNLGIFQWESNFSHDFYKKLFNPDTIKKIKEKASNISYMDLFSMGNGALRPAGESYRDLMCQGIFKDNGHPALNEFLSTTMGYLVYQEEIIEFLHKFCGFTMGQADVVRRCVEENTLITMGNGNVKRIKDIKIGDIVMTVNKYGITEPKKVTNVFNNGQKEVYRIVTNNNYELLATKDHKILTQDGYKKIEDIYKNDMVMSLKKINATKDNLRPNQRLSCEEMFLLGMLIGDGTIYDICKNGDKNNRPSFTNSDIQLIEKFKQCILSRIRPEKGNERKCEFIINSQNGVTVDKIYNIKIKTETSNKALINLLDKYDLRHYANNKKLNNELMSYPIGDKLKNLLGGLFSTDGGCYKEYIDYSTTSEILAYQIKNLLLKFNIYSYVLKSFVNNYNYYCYKVIISQRDSLLNFKREILPYIVGNKKDRYKNTIDNVLLNNKKFNYLMPLKCKNEIITNIKIYNKSLNDVGYLLGYNKNCFNVHKSEKSISDIKAKEICSVVYCPYTYWLINTDYIPLSVKSIEYVGLKNVYDIEVEDNHNYIANGLCVHNCFAKKLGTEEQLPKIKEGFIKIMQEKYNTPPEESEKIIQSFLKVIEDASDYLFSINHSYMYSFIGYICAYLRYYYPLEFLAVMLNIHKNNIEKTKEITEYAKSRDISIKPIRFGFSKAYYSFDKTSNIIYKGIASIKYMNEKIAEELYELSKNEYKTFTDLLIDITEKTSVNTRQLEILTTLNFFDKFGKNGKLLKLFNEFQKKYKKTYVTKTKQKRIEELKKYESQLEDEIIPISQQILAEYEYLGYGQSIYKLKDNRIEVVVNLDTTYTPKLTTYNLTSGEEHMFKISKKDWNKNIKKGTVLGIIQTEKRHKKIKTDDGWQDADKLENWINKYLIIKS